MLAPPGGLAVASGSCNFNPIVWVGLQLFFLPFWTKNNLGGVESVSSSKFLSLDIPDFQLALGKIWGTRHMLSIYDVIGIWPYCWNICLDSYRVPFILIYINSLRPSDTIWWQIWVNIGSGNGLVPNGAITWTNFDSSSFVFCDIHSPESIFRRNACELNP